MKTSDIVWETVVVTVLSLAMIAAAAVGEFLILLLFAYITLFLVRSEHWKRRCLTLISSREKLHEARAELVDSLRYEAGVDKQTIKNMQIGINGLVESNKRLKAELEFAKTSKKLKVKSKK